MLTRGIEAEKVEKVSDAEHKTPGPLFRKKPGFATGAKKYPRGFYLPQ
jgi:hypothetical protein